ncbi:MAG: hypothetical protein K8U57_23085 [Planctomycetes bacterium]|nr:hypothetical protein [Planctomycetota bacterium]
MAGNNAIGSGVLVLSANADGLVSGLNKVDQQTKTFAAKAGGNLGKLATVAKAVGGGVAKGIGFGIGAGLAKKAIGDIAGSFDDLALRARGADRGSLRAIQGSLNLLKGVGLDALQKVANAVAPVLVNLTNVVMRFWQRVEPTVVKVLDGLSTLAFVATEIAGDVADAILDVVSSGGEWVANILDINTESLSMQNVVLGVLRGVGKGFAYVWDTIKAGTGVISVVAGVIVEGLSLILQQVAKAVKGIAELGESLPDAIRPDWLGKAAAAADGFLDQTAEVGRRMRENGMNAIAGWGDSVKKVDPYFDAIAAKFDNTKKGIGELKLPQEIKLGGAFQKGSTEAYSIVARNETSGKLADYNKQQVELQKAMLGALRIIAGGGDKAPLQLKAW